MNQQRRTKAALTLTISPLAMPLHSVTVTLLLTNGATLATKHTLSTTAPLSQGYTLRKSFSGSIFVRNLQLGNEPLEPPHVLSGAVVLGKISKTSPHWIGGGAAWFFITPSVKSSFN